jgi:hypothetical protein
MVPKIGYNKDYEKNIGNHTLVKIISAKMSLRGSGPK